MKERRNISPRLRLPSTGARRGAKGGANPADARLAPLGEVVFPDADDAPARLAQGAIDPAFAGLVGGQLFGPERGVVARLGGVFRASVPEAAVHEHRNPLFGKDEIGFAEDWAAAAPAGDSVPAEGYYQGQFRVLVAVPADAGHDVGALGRGENVRHGG